MPVIFIYIQFMTIMSFASFGLMPAKQFLRIAPLVLGGVFLIVSPAPDVFGQEYKLKITTPEVKSGGLIVVECTSPAAHDENAWIGFYRKDADDKTYLIYTFLNNLTGGRYDAEVPDEPGLYNFRVFADESYTPASVSDTLQVKSGGLAVLVPGTGTPDTESAVTGNSTSSVTSVDLPGQDGATPPATNKPPVRGVTGDITTGKTVPASTVDIPVSGGTIAVNDPASPIDGLELTVPADAYGSGRQFKVSYAPVTGHTFGADFNPISPMISIDNGGAYADKIMTVRIPVKVPADCFAMGFIFDKATGKLEGMPLAAQDGNSVTVATRHFSDLVVSMIPKLKLKKDIDTSFRPGIDDWQFVNNGSYISPDGHCGGQTLTAMWYYFTQPDGADLTLYGRYDNNGNKPATPDLQEDDSFGYRFASVIQEDQWNGFAQRFWKAFSKTSEENTWNAFAYSMQLTGEPQLTAIYSKAGGGHALIAYRIKDSNLYIADPNYPGNTDRRIYYGFGEFTPYNSGANARAIAAGKGEDFETIQYWAKSTIVDFGHIARRWAEFGNKTIGDDLFPAYHIVYADEGTLKELTEGITVTNERITIFVTFGVEVRFIDCFRDGVEIQMASDQRGGYVLKPGTNALGIYVSKKVNNEPNFVDFKYFNVIYNSLMLKPPSQDGEPNRDLTFDLELSQAAPAGAKFEWYVDGKLVKSGVDFGITVSFPDEGTHEVTARLVGADGKVVLQAKGTAIIAAKETPAFVPGNNLSVLQKMTTVSGSFKGKWSVKRLAAAGTDEYFTFSTPSIGSGTGQLTMAWSGAAFSGKRSWGLPTYGSTEEISGTVSADGKTLTSMTWTLNSKAEGQGEGGVGPWNRDTLWKVRFQDIPISQLVFEKATNSTFTFSKNGAELKPFVAEADWHTVTYRRGQKESEVSGSAGAIKWDDTSFQGAPAMRFTIK